jgi:hypothetical protein
MEAGGVKAKAKAKALNFRQGPARATTRAMERRGGGERRRATGAEGGMRAAGAAHYHDAGNVFISYDSPMSFVRRFASPFFLPAALSYHEVLTVAQQSKANAARSEAEAALPGEGQFYAAPRSTLYPFPLSFLCLSRAFRIRPRDPTSLSPSPHFPHHPPITFFAGTAPEHLSEAAGRDETPAERSVPARLATPAKTKWRARPSRVLTKSTGATAGAKVACGMAARAEARAGAEAGG